MIDIKKLDLNDLGTVKLFILKERKDYENFFQIGWNLENIESHFHKGNNLSLGCFVENSLTGLLIGEKIPNDIDFDLEIHIMFISKTNRRKSLGSNILNFIKINKRNLDVSKIFLEVAQNNVYAINFYKKNKFVFFKLRHNYYKENNKAINAMCFSKNL